jgi:hypothetical protein
MLGGENEAPNQILAQRDMIMREVKYYEERASVMVIFLIALVVLGSVCYGMYSRLT